MSSFDDADGGSDADSPWTKLANLSAHGRTEPIVTATAIPFGSFDPMMTFRALGRVGLVARLLELRGFPPSDTNRESSVGLLDVFRSPAVIAQMQPKQDWFLAVDTEEPFDDVKKAFGPNLIAAENSANWVARLEQPDDDRETGGAEPSVRVFNPESSTVYGDLPLDDFLLRMAVQELVWMMSPLLWERRRIRGSKLEGESRATGGPAVDATVIAVEGMFPPNVAVGPDWIVTHGGLMFETIHVLRYRDAEVDFNERFEQARRTLGGQWA